MCLAMQCPHKESTSAYKVMAYVVMAYIVMADVVMTYIVMAYIVMARTKNPKAPPRTRPI